MTPFLPDHSVPGGHSASLYRDHRPEYPESLFQDLREALQRLHPSSPLRGLDLGCGTGQSIRSAQRALRRSLQWTGIDPNSEMIRLAKPALGDFQPAPNLVVSAAENLSFPADAFDFAIAASSWHWFEGRKTLEALQRCLRPDAPLLIVEYQFPRALEHAPFTEWVRRSFNTRWKFTNQQPRGRLRDLLLTAGIRLSKSRKSEWEVALHREGFLKLLCSQARVLAAFENRVDDPQNLESELLKQWPNADGSEVTFTYRGEALLGALPCLG